MALELRQQLKLVQKLVMTPQLRQAIKLLQLNRLELTQALQKELEQNPALEEELLAADSSENKQSLSSTSESREPDTEQDFTERVKTSDNMVEINWQDYANNFDANFSFATEKPPADAPSQLDFVSEKPGLSAYLQWQLAHCELDQEEWDIALFITGSLNRYGFLEADIDEIVSQTGCTKDDADYMLEVIQDLDPPGIGARNVSESLFLQLERLNMGETLAAEIVRDHLSLLETKNYKALIKVTGRNRAAVLKAVNFITSSLTPYPGLPYSKDPINYIVPDVYVRKVDGEYVISLNDEDLPRLKVSSYYKALVDEQLNMRAESQKYIKKHYK